MRDPDYGCIRTPKPHICNSLDQDLMESERLSDELERLRWKYGLKIKEHTTNERREDDQR